jgi:hypothetical protein
MAWEMLGLFDMTGAMRFFLGSSREVFVRYLHVDNIGPGFRIFNPSVTAFGDRILLSLRASNIERSNRTNNFFLLPPHREMKNEIILGELNEDFGLKWQIHVDLQGKANKKPLAPHGFEDMRIVVSPNGRLEGMCCVPSSDYLLKPRAELGFGRYFSTKMARIQFSPEPEIDRVTIYESPFKRRMEKNWSPFYLDGKFCVIYQWNPLIILELLPDGTTQFLKWFDSSDQLKDLRGSSQGVETNNGFLFVVHRKCFVDGKVRFSHQFIELGHDLQPLRISEQFGLVLDTMIEYCAGLARFKDRYLLSFGLNDSTPFIMEMGEKAVERLLVPFAAPFTENDSILSASPETFARVATAEFPSESPLGLKGYLKWRARKLLQAVRR